MITPVRSRGQAEVKHPRREEGTDAGDLGRKLCIAGRLAGLAWSVFALRPRSFARDARALMGQAWPEPEVLGREHVPARGPCLVACNHYHRGNRGGWWTALAVTAAVASARDALADPEVCWVMSEAWTYPEGTWQSRYLTPLSRWVFRRVARVYGFISMPPMPPRPGELEARALAVLRAVRLARRAAREGGMVGLAPEGQDTPDELGEPPENAGRFMALLIEAGLPVLPVGVTELGGWMRVAIGPAFWPEVPAGRAERDEVVTVQVMAEIRRAMGT